MRLRYPAACGTCGIDLAAGVRAHWDKSAKRATCLACLTSTEAAPAEEPAATRREAQPADRARLPIERGTAGASARRQYEQLHRRRETQARERLGRFAGVYLALTNEPQSTVAWARGSSGESRLGRDLAELDDDETIFVFHDRRIPGTRANIDHLAVSASGIYVIDAKNYAGSVRKVDRGGFFSTDLRLYVGRRDCSKLVAGMEKQVQAVRRVLEPLDADGTRLPVRAVLCFVAAEWPLFARPFQLDGVWVEWPQRLAAAIKSPGTLGHEDVRAIAERLAQSLAPA